MFFTKSDNVNNVNNANNVNNVKKRKCVKAARLYGISSDELTRLAILT